MVWRYVYTHDLDVDGDVMDVVLELDGESFNLDGRIDDREVTG